MTRKWCELEQMLLFTDRKSHTCFRLVPESVTLNDPEWRNGHYFALFQVKALTLEANYAKLTDVRPILSVTNKITCSTWELKHGCAVLLAVASFLFTFLVRMGNLTQV